MKKSIFVLVLLSGILFYSCERNEIAPLSDQISEQEGFSSKIIEGKYIVLFEEKGLLKSASIGGRVTPDAVLQTTKNIFEEINLPVPEPEFVYSAALRGIAVELDKDVAEKLANAPGIKGVYPDMMVTFGLPSIQGKPAPPTPSQSTPWGITRIGGATIYNGSAKAWIIDTGIDLDHPDLTVNTILDKDFINGDDVADDDNGHGTHCAGIVAAKSNTIGVVGVAAGATVVPVKVLNRRGSGAYSVIIAGVDYVRKTATIGDVANMSLGGGIYEPIDLAVKNLGAAGIKVSLAAGNESDNANNHSPARAEGTNLYTVSSMAQGDIWSYFSNYGNPPIDFCAPGSSILSTYKGGTYGTMSGTSMAAPHVCGLLLLNSLNSDGPVSGDPDNEPDLIAHK